MVKIETFAKFLKSSSSLKSSLRYLLKIKLDALPNRDTLLFLSSKLSYLRAVKFEPINIKYATDFRDYHYTVKPEAFKFSLPKTITKIEIDQNTVLPQTKLMNCSKIFTKLEDLNI